MDLFVGFGLKGEQRITTSFKVEEEANYRWCFIRHTYSSSTLDISLSFTLLWQQGCIWRGNVATRKANSQARWCHQWGVRRRNTKVQMGKTLRGSGLVGWALSLRVSSASMKSGPSLWGWMLHEYTPHHHPQLPPSLAHRQMQSTHKQRGKQHASSICNNCYRQTEV